MIRMDIYFLFQKKACPENIKIDGIPPPLYIRENSARLRARVIREKSLGQKIRYLLYNSTDLVQKQYDLTNILKLKK